MFFLLGMLFAEPIPIYAFPYSCIDPRFPTLHKGWIVGCNPRGMIDQAYHVETMRIQKLSNASEDIGLGEGVFQAEYGLWNLITQQREKFPRIRTQANAPLSGKDTMWAYTTDDALGIVQGRTSTEIQAHPRGWYPPAWWGEDVVWVEDDGSGGEDLWIYSFRDGARLLRGGVLAQRHPIANGNLLAWVEGENIGLWNREEQRPSFIPALVVDRLTMDEHRVCWSERGADIDIRCSDGFVLHRKEHQLWPAIWNDMLIFREKGQLMIYKLPE